MDNIQVEFWLRHHLKDEANKLTNEQFKKVFPNIEFTNEDSRNNVLRDQLELASIKDSLANYEKKGFNEALEYIDSLLPLPTLSVETKKFCKTKKIECLLNLQKIPEVEVYFQQIKSDIDSDSNVIILASIYFYNKQFDELKKHIKTYINCPPKIPYFWVFVAYILTDEEMESYSDLERVKQLPDLIIY